MEKLYQQFRNQAEFLLIVTAEVGHPIPGLEFLLENPNPDRETRRRNLNKAMQIERVTMPAAMDDVDATAQTAYKAFPLRLVVVDCGGKLAFDSGLERQQGGLDLRRTSAWLEKNLGTSQEE